MRRRIVLALLALGLSAPVLGACGSDPATGGGTSAPAATSGGSIGTGEVPEALQFAAPRVGGGTLDLHQYAGRTVVFWFWAPT